MSEVRVREEGARAVITLARPQAHNALHPELMEALTQAFLEMGKNERVRYVVLAAEGPSFCAGADLRWMRASLGTASEENQRDAERLFTLLETIAGCPRPVVARVHGPALGGGAGLVAACDLAVAHPDAVFGLPEVRLGLAPAVIFPFLLRRVNRSDLVWAALLGGRFPAERAKAMGLVHEVSPDVDEVIEGWGNALLAAGPQALAAVKRLVGNVPSLSWEEAKRFAVALLAELRAGPEAQEGMRAFLEKRPPAWVDR
ncbi:MAG: enoyl-CoA hydratase-related protein [Armatimonadota bacterium]|nr:enoyl-CoA hydratase-related protein [Armatimonadota bacterium]MDR7439211.1 enoyl-CoA hydratase-related protein [Armatimonadota bacterium]MDR7563683.1 enoyl-CoA hydratase-related protein [Armatimonadota bacterium]MDR7567601.1 enoyl-CoA hydratase-related protein [Armatimonadota bacterium]MDR7602003.1 enoyl-CoA hydratase-related protein [Armatimonadota bacterium]